MERGGLEMATSESRKAQVKGWLEGLFADEQATLTASLFAPDAVVHTAMGPRPPAFYGQMALVQVGANSLAANTSLRLRSHGSVRALRCGGQTQGYFGPGVLGIRAAMSEPRVAVEEVLAEGETVVARWTLQGKHTEGPAYGIAPTGVEVRVPGVSFLYCRDDLVREIIDIEATLTLLRQLGVPMPRP